MIPLQGVITGKRPGKVPSGNHGIGGEPIVGYARSRLDEPGKGFLSEVLDRVRIADPCTQDSANYRGELEDILMLLRSIPRRL